MADLHQRGQLRLSTGRPEMLQDPLLDSRGPEAVVTFRGNGLTARILPRPLVPQQVTRDPAYKH